MTVEAASPLSPRERCARESTAFAGRCPEGFRPSMSIRFAGSRSVDDRRRRRLAQEAEAAPNAPAPRRAGKPAAERPAEESRLPRGSSPADTLIPPQLWKLGVIAAAATLIWATILALGDAVDRAQTGFEAIIGLRSGHLVRFFSTVMLLAAGQLAFINLWYRSRSRKDFSGSYKVWFYAAVGWLTLCAFAATGSHWNLADLVLAGRPIAVWNGRLLVWLIPGAIMTLALYRLLLREMRDCDGSLWLLRLSGALALAAAGATLTGPLLWEPQSASLLTAGLSSAWHLVLALAMLTHARHVIHHCNEPPARAIRRWRLGLPRLTSLFARGADRRRAPAGKDASKSRATGKGPKSRSGAKPKRSSTSRSKAAVAEDAADDDDTPNRSLAAATAANSAATDPADLSGTDGEQHDADDVAPMASGSFSKASSSHRQTDRGVTANGAGSTTGRSAPPQKPAAAPSGPSGGVTRRVDPPQSLQPPRSQMPLAQVDDDSEDDAELDGESRSLSKKDRKKLKRQQQSGR